MASSAYWLQVGRYRQYPPRNGESAARYILIVQRRSRAALPQAGDEAPKTLPILTIHLFLRARRDLALGEQEQVATPRNVRFMSAKALAKEPLRAVPKNGAPDPAARGEPEPVVATIVP